MNVSIKGQHMTSDELEVYLGQRFRALRLKQNLDQRTLANNANISVGAVRNLELGEGVILRTVLAVLRVLDRRLVRATLPRTDHQLNEITECYEACPSAHLCPKKNTH